MQLVADVESKLKVVVCERSCALWSHVSYRSWRAQ
jgi:hypothetical protein